jgi:hypothetical protein
VDIDYSWIDIDSEKRKYSEKNPGLIMFYFPQIKHELSADRTRISAVDDRWWMIEMWIWNIRGLIMTGKNASILKKYSGSITLYFPQITHVLSVDRTRISAVRGRRLTALYVVRPAFILYEKT